MYIYKRCKNKYSLVDYVDSKDEITIENRIIKLLRKDKETKDIYNIKSKFTGLFTVYYFKGNYAFIVSEYLLDENGVVKSREMIF